MSMHPYLIVLLCGAVLCAVIFSIRLRKQALPGKVALTALGLSAVLAFVLSKTVYVLALCSRLFPRYGMSAFLRMNADTQDEKRSQKK
jgi:glucan phosphoethanolaminetransferase (alkaline phosphatase superfamily)